MKKIAMLTLLLTLSACAAQPQKRFCIDYSERRARYVRLYIRDEISVDNFVVMNNDLEILSEMGIPNCEVAK